MLSREHPGCPQASLDGSGGSPAATFWSQNERFRREVLQKFPRAQKRRHRVKKEAIGLKKTTIGPNAPLLEVRFLEKIVLISTETLYIVLVYIHTDLSPVALYTHLFRIKVSSKSICSLIGKARVEWNMYIVRRSKVSMYVCMYINTIYSVSVLTNLIFSKNG